MVDLALLSTAMADDKEMKMATVRQDSEHVDSNHVAHCQTAVARTSSGRALTDLYDATRLYMGSIFDICCILFEQDTMGIRWHFNLTYYNTADTKNRRYISLDHEFCTVYDVYILYRYLSISSKIGKELIINKELSRFYFLT